MAIEQGLFQKQSQRMVISPRMQQALHILQLPLMELRQLIQQELVENPVIEEVPEEADIENQENNGDDDSRSIIEEMEEIARSQELWDEYLRNLNHPAAMELDEDKESYARSLVTVPPNLQEHLLQQLRFSDCPDCSIGELIIGNIDRDGYLRSSTQEIAQLAGCTPEKAEEVLALIQTFDPPGVAARDIRECLLIQLKTREVEDPLVIRIVSEYLPDIERKKYPHVARNLAVEVEDVTNAAKIVATLEPKPGHKFSPVSPQYIVPDITVKKMDGEYQITVNDDGIPELRISPYYRKLLNSSPSTQTRKYLTEKLRSGLWVIKSIKQRKRTMYRVAECIVKKQRGFLDTGISHLQPLRLKDVARELNLHESTISRVTTDKYMETRRGIFELKYFFSGTLDKGENKTTSTRSIRARIAQLIKEENPKKPLADHKILELLQKEGTSIARRTIAKYREQLGILPVQLRKQY
jgi:RNA polymerase sigma-54 factor